MGGITCALDLTDAGALWHLEYEAFDYSDGSAFVTCYAETSTIGASNTRIYLASDQAVLSAACALTNSASGFVGWTFTRSGRSAAATERWQDPGHGIQSLPMQCAVHGRPL